MPNEGNAVAQVAPLKQALALATEAGDISALRDVAAMGAALQKGAKARGLGIENENAAAEVVLRAERAIGQTLRAMRADGTLYGEGFAGGSASKAGKARHGSMVQDEGMLTLADIGLNSGQSQRFQQLAAIPESVFEDKVAGLLATGERFAKLDFYRLVKGGEKRQRAALVDIREAMHADDATPAFRAFEKAAHALSIATLPDDELMQVAAIIRDLVSDYTAERSRRQAAA